MFVNTHYNISFFVFAKFSSKRTIRRFLPQHCPQRRIFSKTRSFFRVRFFFFAFSLPGISTQTVRCHRYFLYCILNPLYSPAPPPGLQPRHIFRFSPEGRQICTADNAHKITASRQIKSRSSAVNRFSAGAGRPLKKSAAAHGRRIFLSGTKKQVRQTLHRRTCFFYRDIPAVYLFFPGAFLTRRPSPK